MSDEKHDLLPEQRRPADVSGEALAKPEAAKPAPAPQKLYALLDEAGVLAGYSHDAEGPRRRVEVPVGCDLQVGKYEHRNGVFVPLMSVWNLERKAHGLDPMFAVYFALCAMRDGQLLPAYTLAWMDEYARTWDGVMSSPHMTKEN
jgi:hypothetical protein